MRRVTLVFLATAALLYLGYAAAMVVLHPRFIYPFSSEPFAAEGWVAHEIAVADDVAPLPVYVAEGTSPEAPIIVYFMGNLGALGPFLPMLDHHRAAGRHVVAMTYRGGGGTAGTASERRLKADAEAAISAARDLTGAEGPLVVQGFSLGTGLALHVAARAPVDGVILTAPYTALCRLMARAAWLPACILPGVQTWRSIDETASVTAPVLLQHGTADALIPFSEGQALALALEPSVQFRPIEGGGHSNLLSFPDYLPEIDRFLDTLPAP